MLRTKDSRLNFGAAYGFEVLGPLGKEAVPSLIHIYKVGVSEESQAATAKALGSIGPAAASAIHSVVKGTSHSSRLVRKNCILALIQIRAEPKLVTPILIKSLRDPDIKEFAAIGLGLFSLEENAREMIPSLVEALKDPDEYVRNVAARTLREIDPEVAAKAVLN
jgi:HEAT repeat protein